LGEDELYCPNCGASVDEESSFCPNCGAQIGGRPAASGAPQSEIRTSAARSRPRIGYIISIIGGALILLSGIGYLIVGNPVAGVLGIIFGILVITFSRRLYKAADVKSLGLVGVMPFFIGMIVLIVSGTVLPFDIGVSLAGCLTVVGNSAMLAGK